MGFIPFDSTVVLDERAIGAPALALTDDGRFLVLAWTEYSAPHLISLAICDLWYTPLAFGRKLTLPFSSVAGPGLSTGRNSRVHLAWRGGAYDAQLYFASALLDPNSQTFGMFSPLALNEYSFYGPALAGDPFSDTVLLAWTGTDEFALVNTNFSYDAGRTFNQKVTLREDSIGTPGCALVPSVGIVKSLAYLFWTGTDANSSLNVVDTVDGWMWLNKQILNEESPLGPGGGASKLLDSVYLAWI